MKEQLVYELEEITLSKEKGKSWRRERPEVICFTSFLCLRRSSPLLSSYRITFDRWCLGWLPLLICIPLVGVGRTELRDSFLQRCFLALATAVPLRFLSLCWLTLKLPTPSWAKVVLKEIGGMTAPVASLGSDPTWIALVENPNSVGWAAEECPFPLAFEEAFEDASGDILVVNKS